MMRRKDSFFSIFLRNLYLQVSATGIVCRKYRCLTMQVDAFVYAHCKLLIMDHYCVQHVVVDDNAQTAVLLMDIEIQWHLLCLRWFDNVHGKRSIHLLLSEFFSPYVLHCTGFSEFVGSLSFQVWFGAARPLLNQVVLSTRSQPV